MVRNRLVVLLVLTALVSTSTFSLSQPFLNSSAGTEPVDLNDTTPPVADAGPDKTVDEDTTVTFDASGSTDDVGIVNYTWSFMPADLYAEPQTRLTLPFDVTDAVFDPIRPYVYVSDMANKKVHFINLVAGSIEKSFDVSFPPEAVALNPNASTLFVALLTRPHSSSWPDGFHEAYIARFDLELQIKETEFHITEDPYDMVATSDEFLVVSSGSGDGHYLRVFYARDGMETGKSWGATISSRLALHPSESVVYEATSWIRRYTYTPGGIRYDWLSTDYGSSNIWPSPDGEVIITSGGSILEVGDTKETDMIFIEDMTGTTIWDLKFDNITKTIFTSEGYSLNYYDSVTFERIGSDYWGHAEFIGVYGQWVYGVLNGSIMALPHPKTPVFGKTVQYAFDEPGVYFVNLTVRDAAGNFNSDSVKVTVLDITPPIAEAGPDQTVIHGVRAIFDGSESTDNTGIISYTWNFTDEQPQMLGGTHRSYYFLNTGTFVVTLTVMDTAGNVGTDQLNVTVNPVPLVTYENARKGFRIGIPEGWEVEFDHEIQDVGTADLIAFGPTYFGINTNIVIVSERGPVKETDEYLVSEAEAAIEEIQQEFGTVFVERGPEIIEVNTTRGVIFELWYPTLNMRQFMVLAVDEDHGRMWGIGLTTGIGLNQTLPRMFDAVVQSFEILEPQPASFLQPDFGIFAMAVILGAVVGLLAGLYIYYAKKRRSSPDEQSVGTAQSEERTTSQLQPNLVSGAPLYAQRRGQLCVFCGSKLKFPYRFCTHCGSRVD
jgi:hypothetical protein